MAVVPGAWVCDRKPANFTEPVWSRPESAPRAFEAITRGVPGTPMPAWGTALSADDRWALVAFLTSVSEHPPASASGPLTHARRSAPRSGSAADLRQHVGQLDLLGQRLDLPLRLAEAAPGPLPGTG